MYLALTRRTIAIHSYGTFEASIIQCSERRAKCGFIRVRLHTATQLLVLVYMHLALNEFVCIFKAYGSKVTRLRGS